MKAKMSKVKQTRTELAKLILRTSNVMLSHVNKENGTDLSFRGDLNQVKLENLIVHNMIYF